MTLAERVLAVGSLGFNSRQSAFLTTVLLHGGYCLPRQYATFIGRNGKTVRLFMDHLVERRLGERLTYRANRGSIYHLYARSLYAAIGQEDRRNRRQASPAVMARNLMVLDFVLTQPNMEWAAADADKTDLFVNRLGVPETLLAQRTHSSNQRLPVFVSGTPPAVNFVCVVTEASASTIHTFVRDHAQLLKYLQGWTLHVVMPRGVAVESACRNAYERALASVSLSAVSKEDFDWFSRTRELVLGGDLRDLAVEDLRRYRELAANVGRRLEMGPAGPLVIHVLPHSYSQFGSLAGVV